MLIAPVSEPVVEPVPEAPEESVPIAPEELVVSVELVLEPEPPLPQAVKAPNTNTNNSFFIVSLFIVIVDLRFNAEK